MPIRYMLEQAFGGLLRAPTAALAGAYVHGLFSRSEPREALLALFGARSNGLDQNSVVDSALDEIAETLEQSLDIVGLAHLAGIEP